MGAIGILRELWSRRWVVAIAGVLSVAIGLLMCYQVDLPFKVHSRQYTVGIASTTALIDTPTSQVVDLGKTDTADGAALPGRASLLANLLATSPLKDQIAKQSGIDPSSLIAIAPSTGPVGTTPTQLATGTKVSAGDPKANVLTLQTDVQIPILVVNAQSPDVRTAERLANGTLAALQAHLKQVADADGTPQSRRIVVKQLGTASVGLFQRGPRKLYGIVAAIFLFAAACGSILAVGGLARGWRRAEAVEKLSRAYNQGSPDAANFA